MAGKDFATLIVRKDDFTMIRVNSQFTQLLEIDQEDLTGQPIRTIVHPDDHARLQQILKQGLEQYSMDLRLMAKNGSVISLYVTIKLNSITQNYIFYFYSDQSLKDMEEERNRIKTELLQGIEGYRNFFEEAHLAMCRTNADGKIILANSTFFTLIGQDAAQLDFLEKKLNVFDYHGEKERFWELIGRNGAIHSADFQWTLENGKKIMVREQLNIVQNALGDIRFYDFIIEDISTTRMKDILLDLQDAYLKIWFENSPIGAILLSNEGRIMNANQRFLDMFGYTLEEIRLESIFDLIVPPEEKKSRLQLMERALGGELVEFMGEGVKKNGQRLALQIKQLPVMVSDHVSSTSSLMGVCAFYVDISPLKETERKLKRAFAILKTMLENIPLAVLFVDRQGHVVMSNRVFSQEWGVPKEEVEGHDFIRLFEPWPQFVAQHDKTLATGQPSTICIQEFGPHKDAIYEISQTRVDNEDNTILGVVSVFKNITGHVQSQNLLKNSQEILERQVQERTESLAGINRKIIDILNSAIDLRDPLTAGHQKRVTLLVDKISAELDLSLPQRKIVHSAALLHDIGKLRIPFEILNRAAWLDEDELKLVRKHPIYSYDMIRELPEDELFFKIILQHQESQDGSGYPHGLKNDEIIFEARILHVADAVEAMLSFRPHRPPLSLNQVIHELEEDKGNRYDLRVVEATLKILRNGFVF